MDNSYPAEIERLMEKKGYVKQRGAGVSVNALAAASGIHVDTVKSILQGGRASRPKTVEAVAGALGITSSQLLEHAGTTGGEIYVGPDVTRRMSDRERAALTEFLLATLDRDRKEGGEHGQGSAPNTAPDDKVAQLRPSDPPVTRKFTPRWELDDEAASEGEEGIAPNEIPDEST
ncbi:helix-turn-helix domain-containing protein [Nesterenkonia aurantiaca]|uniref:helix-turn-helix domain-containing protein n=1 Tax=Nesterenkonia aurantiaca TaxID=1436010 RepID=UPI003EE492B0